MEEINIPGARRHTDKGISDGYLEPHPIPHLQARLRAGHGLSDRCHVGVDGEVEVIESWGENGGQADTLEQLQLEVFMFRAQRNEGNNQRLRM